jgi:hypothetical protein
MAHLRAVHTQQPQHLSRIKDLEDEVHHLTVENAQLKTEVEKAQRRWEKLKEGARRRRGGGNAANGTIVVGNSSGNEHPTILEEKEEDKEGN